MRSQFTFFVANYPLIIYKVSTARPKAAFLFQTSINDITEVISFTEVNTNQPLFLGPWIALNHSLYQDEKTKTSFMLLISLH